jgi:hypothetical protein
MAGFLSCRNGLLLLMALLYACDGRPPPTQAPVRHAIDSKPTPPELLDPAFPPALPGEDGWDFVRSVEADLNGDGRASQLLLMARAELVRGRPAWDDGQPWQVQVVEADGPRTLLYSRRLQIGTLTVRLVHAEAGSAAAILLLEHTPDSLALYEVFYRGPDDFDVSERFQRRLDPRGDFAVPVFP